jgi:hypothetical protein
MRVTLPGIGNAQSGATDQVGGIIRKMERIGYARSLRTEELCMRSLTIGRMTGKSGGEGGTEARPPEKPEFPRFSRVGYGSGVPGTMTSLNRNSGGI